MPDSSDDLTERGRAIFERLREAAGQDDATGAETTEPPESGELTESGTAGDEGVEQGGTEDGSAASADQGAAGDAAAPADGGDGEAATREAWAPMLDDGPEGGPVDLDRSGDGPAPDGGMRADALLADATMAPGPADAGDASDAHGGTAETDLTTGPVDATGDTGSDGSVEPSLDAGPHSTPDAGVDAGADSATPPDDDAPAGDAAGPSAETGTEIAADEHTSSDDRAADDQVDDGAASDDRAVDERADAPSGDHARGDAGGPGDDASAAAARDGAPETGAEGSIAGTNDPSGDSSPTESGEAPPTPERAPLPGSVDLPPLDVLAPAIERDDLLAPAAASDELDEVPAHHATEPSAPAEAAEPEPDAPAEAVSPFARPLPRVMAVANQKGGVGKTTTAVNLGACLADIGYRVLVVDLDPQGNASTGLGINIRDLQGSMYDVILHDLPIEDCVEATSVRNLFCAPSSLDLAGAEIELVPAFSREQRLKRALEDVRDDYDFVLIDCPPSLGLLTVNGLAAATEVVVPIQCEYYALEGLGQLLRNVNLVQKNLNPILEVSAIVLVMYDARTKLADQVVTEVRSHFGEKVCRNVIPRTVRLSEAPSFGQPIIAFDSSSRGAIAYRELAKEVSGGTPQRAR